MVNNVKDGKTDRSINNVNNTDMCKPNSKDTITNDSTDSIKHSTNSDGSYDSSDEEDHQTKITDFFKSSNSMKGGNRGVQVD